MPRTRYNTKDLRLILYVKTIPQSKSLNPTTSPTNNARSPGASEFIVALCHRRPLVRYPKNAKKYQSTQRMAQQKSTKKSILMVVPAHGVLVSGVPAHSCRSSVMNSKILSPVFGCFLIQVCSFGVVRRGSDAFNLHYISNGVPSLVEGSVRRGIPGILHQYMVESLHPVRNWLDCWYGGNIHVHFWYHWG